MNYLRSPIPSKPACRLPDGSQGRQGRTGARMVQRMVAGIDVASEGNKHHS